MISVSVHASSQARAGRVEEPHDPCVAFSQQPVQLSGTLIEWLFTGMSKRLASFNHPPHHQSELLIAGAPEPSLVPVFTVGMVQP